VPFRRTEFQEKVLAMLTETKRRSYRDLNGSEDSQAGLLARSIVDSSSAAIRPLASRSSLARYVARTLCTVAWTLGAILVSAVGVEAQNGAVLSTLTGPALDNEVDVADACAAADGTVYVTGGRSGNVIHLDTGLAVVPADTILNHHGEFDPFTNPVTARGIAFRTDTGTLVTLGRRKPTGGAGSFELREVQTDGVAVGGVPIVVNVEANSSDLFGLTWNPTTNQLLTVDCTNDRVLVVNMDGSTGGFFKLPGDVPEFTTLHSGGITYEPNAPISYVYVTLGDIFTTGPSRIERLILSGTTTGVSTPIPESIDATTLRGIELATVAGNDVFLALTSDTIYVLDRENIVPNPVSNLECRVNLSGDVELCWESRGPLAGSTYPFGVRILRNGEILAQGVHATEFVDPAPPAPPQGDLTLKVTYSVEGSGFDGANGQGVSCATQVLRGGLHAWRPFPGKRAFDIARDPDSGYFYVTDSFGEGAIWVLDENLDPLPSTPEAPNPLPSPFGTVAPTGIAFVPPTGEIGDDANPSLMVIKADSVLMRRIRLDGTSITNDFPMGVQNNVGSGLTYNTVTEGLTFIDSGNAPDSQLVSTNLTGTVSSQILPPAFLTGVLHNGLTMDSNTQTLYVVFGDDPAAARDDSVRLIRIQPSGPPVSSGEINFGLTCPMGDTAGIRDAVGGVEVVNNLAYVVGSEANAIFVTLIEELGEQFCRGDVDMNQVLDITDIFLLASYLFIENSDDIPCEDAADFNDDGSLTIADPICGIFFMFNGTCALNLPTCPDPGPGFDSTPGDQLGCEGAGEAP
jgi:hypothetical protein